MEEDPSSPHGSDRGWFSRLLQRLCPAPLRNREEILSAVMQASDVDILPASSVGLIESALGFHDLRVRDIMIPRGQMDVIDATASLDSILEAILESGHSRYPVIGENRDEVIGILLVKELLRHYADPAGSSFDLRKLLRAPMFVPESKRLDALLAEFRLTRTHMAIVLDEFSGVAGLVTIEDVLEEIVGDIDDEFDTDVRVHNIQQQGQRRFTVRALTPIHEFNTEFETDFPDDEYDTIGGLVTHELGHLPRRGEVVRMGGFEFKVLGADKRRLHLLLATKLARSLQEEGDAEAAP